VKEEAEEEEEEEEEEEAERGSSSSNSSYSISSQYQSSGSRVPIILISQPAFGIRAVDPREALAPSGRHPSPKSAPATPKRRGNKSPAAPAPAKATDRAAVRHSPARFPYPHSRARDALIADKGPLDERRALRGENGTDSPHKSRRRLRASHRYRTA
jgi:hypothetical protein